MGAVSTFATVVQANGLTTLILLLWNTPVEAAQFVKCRCFGLSMVGRALWQGQYRLKLTELALLAVAVLRLGETWSVPAVLGTMKGTKWRPGWPDSAAIPRWASPAAQSWELRIMRILTALCLVFLFSAAANNASAGEQLFDQLDQNSDGWIEAKEIDAQHRRLYDRLLRTGDADKDGRLSSNEFQICLQPKQAEKPLVKKQGSEIPGADALLLLLARMDANTNGQIEAREVPEPLLGIFHRIEDRLGGERDGVLNRRELTQAGPGLSRIAQRVADQMGLDVEVELALLSEKQWNNVQNMLSRRGRANELGNPDRARELFRQLDANSDGQVTLEEVPDQFAQRFQQLLDRADRNRDEQISEDELMTVSRIMKAMEGNRPSADQIAKGTKQLLKQWDRDGDKRLSQQELPRRMAPRFDRLDQDGDGYLDRDEMARVVDLLSRFRRPVSDQDSNPAEMMQEK